MVLVNLAEISYWESELISVIDIMTSPGLLLIILACFHLVLLILSLAKSHHMKSLVNIFSCSFPWVIDGSCRASRSLKDISCMEPDEVCPHCNIPWIVSHGSPTEACWHAGLVAVWFNWAAVHFLLMVINKSNELCGQMLLWVQSSCSNIIFQ